MTTYIELRAHSAFSFGDGAVSPERLAARAAELGYPSIGLTDTTDLGGAARFADACQQHKIAPVVGAELIVDGHPLALLAASKIGCQHLSGLITRARVGNLGAEDWRIGASAPPRGRAHLRWADVVERSDDLHLLTGPASGLLATRLRAGDRDGAARLLQEWRDTFGDRLSVEVQCHDAGRDEAALAGALVELAEREGVPWVVTHDPRYIDRRGRVLHDVLTALRHDTDVDTAAARGWLHPSGQWQLLPPEEMAVRWQGREAGLARSVEIAEQCHFQVEWLRPPLPKFKVPDGYADDDAYLHAVTYAGAAERWTTLSPAQTAQLEHELGTIRRLGFSGFFLVMWEAVTFARKEHILCQGRGSAANSAVAYCLGVTAVDPVKYGLLFERFLSEVRIGGQVEAPDIDVDVEHERREEVLNHVYDAYERDKSAITCVTQIYSAPTAFQDAMRALGYPAELAFAITKRLHRADCVRGAKVVARELGRRHGFDPTDARGRTVLAAVRACQDLPRLRSTHPGGFVLSSQPLGDYLPIEETTMGRTIVQFDKDDLDIIGVPKFDFLGLGALSQVRRAFDAIEVRTGTRPSMYAIPQDDRLTYSQISRAETIGMFQIESRAQIASIVHTRPEHLYDIVVQVALIRPGPIQANFVRPYTRRRRGLEPVTYADPRLEPILKRTQGIPVFQEQAMRIAMELGGYTASEADALRRTMGHQRKAKRLEAEIAKLHAKMLANGVDPACVDRIAEELQSFANYGFPESHAWSFALIAYATAWLKARYPTEFYLGLLNSWPMGFYPPATLMHDARRHGVTVRGPCLRDGDADCTTEPGEISARPVLRIGWRFVRGMGAVGLATLREARSGGPFVSIADVVRRAKLTRGDALALARAGAFGAWAPERREAAWIALGAVGDTLPLAPASQAGVALKPLTRRQRVFLDYFATGMSLDGHPMEFLRPRLHEHGVHDSRSIVMLRGREEILVAGLIVVRQHPQSAKGTNFLLLEDEHGFINVIVPPAVVAEYRDEVRHAVFILIAGRFQRDGPEVNVVAEKLRRLDEGGLVSQSHDFQ